ELGIEPLRRRRLVAFARPRQPPAADLDRARRVADVDDAVELIVIVMPWCEIRGAARHVDELAIDEPQGMHAARMRPRRVEVRNKLRLIRDADVEQFES